MALNKSTLPFGNLPAGKIGIPNSAGGKSVLNTGGLILYRLVSKNEDRQSFMEFAEMLNREEIVEFLNKKTIHNK